MNNFFTANKSLVEAEIRERFTILENNFDLISTVKEDFFGGGVIYRSELNKLATLNVGVLFELSEEEKTMIRQLENKLGIKVYHIILNHTIEGKVYSLLYVSQYQEEWALDKEELKEGQPLAYVYCPFDDFCSEFGGIGIDKGYGGIIRIW